MYDRLRVDYKARSELPDLQLEPYFDPAWYARTYGAELLPDEDPLLHYVRTGERANAWPSPHFDPEWYRQEYALGEHESPLHHYILNRAGGALSPLPVFDAAAYSAEHPQWRDSAPDPYLHSLQRAQEDPSPAPAVTFAAVLELVGGNSQTATVPATVEWDAFREALQLFIPLIPFDAEWYCNSNPDVAEALRGGHIASAHGHFIEHGFFEGRAPISQPKVDP